MDNQNEALMSGEDQAPPAEEKPIGISFFPDLSVGARVFVAAPDPEANVVHFHKLQYKVIKRRKDGSIILKPKKEV